MANVFKKKKKNATVTVNGINIQTKSLKTRVWNNRQYYLLILPALLYVIIFNYIPMGGLQIAFKNYKVSLGIWDSPWVGFRNFKDFFGGYYFKNLMVNTFALSLYQIIIGFPIPIIVALLLNELGGKFKKTAQTVLYAPHFISTVVIVGMMNLMFSPTTGIINHFLNGLGLESVYFMGEPKYFRHMFVWSNVWQQMGWGAVIYLAALSGVDPAHHEAAQIDGATRLQRIIHINLPCILPTIMIQLIMRLGRVATIAYEKVYLMQNELNIDVAEVISTYVYKRGIINTNYSFSTAVGLFNNVINVSMLLLANYISKKVSKTSLF